MEKQIWLPSPSRGHEFRGRHCRSYRNQPHRERATGMQDQPAAGAVNLPADERYFRLHGKADEAAERPGAAQPLRRNGGDLDSRGRDSFVMLREDGTIAVCCKCKQDLRVGESITAEVCALGVWRNTRHAGPCPSQKHRRVDRSGKRSTAGSSSTTGVTSTRCATCLEVPVAPNSFYWKTPRGRTCFYCYISCDARMRRPLGSHEKEIESENVKRRAKEPAETFGPPYPTEQQQIEDPGRVKRAQSVDGVLHDGVSRDYQAEGKTVNGINGTKGKLSDTKRGVGTDRGSSGPLYATVTSPNLRPLDPREGSE